MRSLLIVSAFVFATACGHKQAPQPAKPAPEPAAESKAAPEPAHDEQPAEKSTKAMGAQVDDDSDDDADDKAKR